MKKITLLIFSCILASTMVSCVKDDVKKVIITSDDDKLAGEKIQVGENENVNPYYKLFVLNEGAYMANNSTLDFLRFTDNTYVRDAFGKMNPTLAMNLGDIGNDLQVYANSLWAAMNGSGIVEVMSAYDEKHLATIPVPQPRNIAFYDSYAYVSSYATIKDAEEGTGTLYKISLRTLEKIDSISVGYNPEGVAVCQNKIFVANSGGLHAGFDNRVSVISTETFKVTNQIELPFKNLKNIVSTNDKVWVTAQTDYSEQHTSLSCIDAKALSVVDLPAALKEMHVSSLIGYPSLNMLFALGADSDIAYPYSGYNFFSVDTKEMTVEKIPFAGSAASDVVTPYGLQVNVFTGDIYIADGGDYVNPGKVYCFSPDLKTKRWDVTAGVIPAHFALYSPVYY
ncbi:MAG: hypothetical protein IK022_00175 [Bacteroidales bacterium]|nr:hypothetical protein [Bacteroidales bacterium]